MGLAKFSKYMKIKDICTLYQFGWVWVRFRFYRYHSVTEFFANDDAGATLLGQFRAGKAGV